MEVNVATDNIIEQENLELQQQMAERWNRFASHRENISAIIERLSKKDAQKIAVWGAGSCVDIDLTKLLSLFKHVALLDINKNALDAAELLQSCYSNDCIHVYPGIDFFGINNDTKKWKHEPPDDDEIAAAKIKAASHTLPVLDGDYEITLSDCVLSQLVQQLAQVMGEAHPQLFSLISTIRMRHLELMLEHTCAGGFVLLITDLVSSLTAPVLLDLPSVPMKDIMDGLIKDRNFFTGCNPYAVMESCRQNQQLNKQIEKIELTEPWLWQLDGGKVLVYCLVIQKALKQVSNYYDMPSFSAPSLR